jgi:hypothetical protein
VEKDIIAPDTSEHAPLNEMAGSWTSTAGEVEEGSTNFQQVSPDVEEGPKSVQEPANTQDPVDIEPLTEIVGGAEESESAPGSTSTGHLRVKFPPFRLLL